MHGCGYPEISVKISGGKTFTIRSKGASKDRVVKSVTLNGKPHDPFFLRYSEIMAGGELVFDYGDR